MNIKPIKYLTYSLATGFLVLGISTTVNAAGFAGITAMTTANTNETTSVNTQHSTLSGVSLAVATSLADEAVVADESAIVTTAAASYSDVAICRTENYVNVRAEASEESESVGKLYNNGAASIITSDGDWLKISSGSVTGYVKSEYLVVGDEELAKSVSRRIATVNADTLYVRSEMSSEASSVTQVPNGDDLTVVDESTIADGWVKVTCDGGEGYVSTDYVSLSTKYTLAESKAEEEARLAREAAEREAARKAAEKAAAQKAARKAAKASASSSSGSSRSYAPPSGGSGSAIVGYGSQFVGNPYVYGGSSLTGGTDCSGFVMSVYGANGVSLPHSSSAMRSVGYAVSASEMQPGDIVCYSGHVGIYAGNGTLLHASNPSTGITYSNVNYRPIITVRRIY